MEIEKIRQLRLAHPFKPFALVLDNGRRLVIDKPYGLAMSPTKNLVLVPTEEEGAIWFHSERVANIVMLDNGVAI